ncbi:MAG: hypothetical protein LC117_05895 [Bacteroidia bacterium]|nr:hypothetical protein [Bacteroidia bacterium]
MNNSAGAVSQSTDNGLTWNLLPTVFEYPVTAIFTVDSLIWYAGSSEPSVYKTTDGGKSWKKLWVRTPFPPQFRQPVRSISATNDTTIFFALGGGFEAGGIWKTYDGGTTWSAFAFNFEIRDLRFSNPLTGIACGYGSVICTSDGGESWQPSPCPNAYFMALNQDENGRWWAVSFNGGVYFSDNPALGWKISLAPSNLLSSRKQFRCLLIQGRKITVAGSEGIIMKSNIYDHNWTTFQSCLKDHLRCMSYSESEWFAGGDHGTIISFNGF